MEHVMQLRDFGDRSGLQVHPVSIGAMRLPKDALEAVELIRYAIDSGLRYIDTSRGYGESEWLLGRALRDGYRDKVILSSKWSPWITRIQPTDEPTADCIRRRIDETLLRLGVDYLDYYQVWNIQSEENYQAATRRGGSLDGIRQAMDEGVVKRTGFTTHDSPENLLKYLPDLDWAEIVLMTFNALNPKYRDALQAYREAGIGTIVMNPVGGGRLAQESSVFDQLRALGDAVDMPNLALRYILGHPYIDTAIVGINRKSDVDAAVAAAEQAPLTPEQIAAVDAFVQARSPEDSGFCTGCRYCLPCPEGIDIPAVMSALYDAEVWDLKQEGERRYGRIKGSKADACVACNDCIDKCTQQLQIPDLMEKAAAMFTA
jgi:hypothetical protein